MIQDPDFLEIFTLKQLASFKNRIVLEIGCGDGRISAFLADETKEFTGIDTEVEQIKRAKKKSSVVMFCAGSGENIPFPRYYFHIVLFTLSLHHQNGEKALSEAYRVLSPGGWLIVVEPCLDGQVQRLFNVFHDETDALRSSREYMERSPFIPHRSKIVETEWIFENRIELQKFDFDNGGKITDKTAVAQIEEILNESLDKQPVRVQEKLEFFLYKKV
ncbi:class I SAM-dependent methyltransferase [candidate division KSB1 bacterium]|nr:class I SAM-dependent methyltransferase [candidate division KSB1 bacterium]